MTVHSDPPRARVPLRVSILVHNVAHRGGAFYHGYGFARGLAMRGHDVTLMSIAPRSRTRFREELVDGIRLVESPDLLTGSGRTGWDPWDTLRRAAWARRQRCDVWHTVDSRPAVILPALFGRWARGGILVCDWTDWWGRGGATSERSGLAGKLMGPLELAFEEWPKPYADATITISRALYQRALGLGLERSTMLHLQPGSDVERMTAVPRDEARRRLGLEPRGPRVAYLGNVYQRDADLLVESMRTVRRSFPGVVLTMVGEFRAEVPREAVEQGWLVRTGHVDFETMQLQLAAADVLVLPLQDTVANRGRWPSKINDYLAAGRAIVSCAVGDLVELFEKAEIGRLSRPDPRDFARQVEAVLSDPARAATMGANARRLAEREYSWAAVGERLESFYLRMLERAAAPERRAAERPRLPA
jgi:glycosyltransferase involved in cell wall biosynthesis